MRLGSSAVRTTPAPLDAPELVQQVGSGDVEGLVDGEVEPFDTAHAAAILNVPLGLEIYFAPFDVVVDIEPN